MVGAVLLFAEYANVFNFYEENSVRQSPHIKTYETNITTAYPYREAVVTAGHSRFSWSIQPQTWFTCWEEFPTPYEGPSLVGSHVGGTCGS
jgi:hypothetical protein